MKRTLFIYAIALVIDAAAFAPLRRALLLHHRQSTPSPRSRRSSLDMVLTPIGPFCPFRSSAVIEMEPRMERLLNTASPEFATEMSRIQLDMQLGNTPDKDSLLRVADGIDKAVDEWETLLTRSKLSGDFQTQEFAKLTQAQLETHGVTPESIAKVMRWQSGCMRALAMNTLPPMPPPDLDLQAMMESTNEERPAPSMTAMAAAEVVIASPFSPYSDVFNEPLVKEEYEQLCRDHANLIELGAKYSSFDPAGKLYFINEIEKIEGRWDVFFARFSLLGKLDKKFIRQCNQFLESMNITEEDYRKLLKKAHQIMRDDAERERNLVF
jgi:hypothetical protein